MLQHGYVNHAITLGYANTLAEISNRFRRIAAPPKAGKRRHPRIIPACDVFLPYQLKQPALAQHRVSEIEASEFNLLRMMNIELIEKPVVKRSVIFEFQRTDRMRDSLDRIRLPVGEVVSRINAPFVARAVMRRVKDSVHDRIAHVQVRRGHVDLRPQGSGAIGKFSRLHALKQI